MHSEEKIPWEDIKKLVDAIVFQSTKKYLTDLEVKVLKGSWEGKKYDDIARELNLTNTYIQNDVGAKLWKKLTDAIGEPVSKSNFRQALNRAKEKQKSQQIFPSTNLRELPHHPVPLNSPLYIERYSPESLHYTVESFCYEAIAQPAALIRIKAPRQMGKTSLLDRILAQARNYGYRTVRLNLQDVDEVNFSNLDNFLHWFCAYISLELNICDRVQDYWKQPIGSKISCKTYLQDYIFPQINTPLVLAFDEVDRIFSYPEVSQGFFGLLRTCHEEANNRYIWKQLRLVVVHSTENYGLLDINHSPFNVGESIELTEFTSIQVQDLAQRHQIDWSHDLVQELMAMVGGHPYLVRMAFYHFAQPTPGKWGSLEQLLQDAPRDTGIYSQHLRRHLGILRANVKLAAAFKQIISTIEPVSLDPILGYQLHSMGLIKWQSNQVIPRCELYRQYFKERLVD
ncbi:AAA-like domain-containing protein [Nostoc sp. FACHB-87]|uniref:AAA-like domain-containing protein n=1 Tax=Nostocales TaxID=1161 RepID=UPI001681D06C|nr:MULTISPECIES: AAA-like domain-containing protein [Nostocales]MBD2456659.1 AAA-like domain-containing protein [Nostoc sp. FACHB-87]MBD2478087.1 AAA-like domain-containing protein [Anabaena sp. FACHB-83]MBD2492382.1 AAA-like domain-containing protein [Aulosira sp. FACHB-615]